MSNIKSIRKRLGVTQVELGSALGCTQSNVGHYENGQTVPPGVAARLIAYAQTLGHAITFNDIYEPELIPALANTGQAATKSVAQGVA